MYEGDFDTAIRRYEEATVIAREEGDERTISLSLQNLGLAHEGAGNLERAIALLEESIAIARRAKDPADLASTQRGLARVLLDSDPELGERTPAREPRPFKRAGRRQRDRHLPGDRLGAGRSTHRRAPLGRGGRAASRGRRDPAARRVEATFAARVEAALKAALGPEAFAAGVAEGATLPQSEAVALAIGTERGLTPLGFGARWSSRSSARCAWPVRTVRS